MDCEIEFHPVGEGSRAGDAISVRYWDGYSYRVIVIDGGTDSSGANLVAHIREYYGEQVELDHVISTHPDTDHACGLREIMRSFRVHNLWLHGLWHHADDMLPYFRDKRWGVDGLRVNLRHSYPVIEELIELAIEQETPVYEPFEGSQIGPFKVLSPTRWAYTRLVPQFRKTPDADTDALAAENILLPPSTRRKGIFAAIAEKVQDWVYEPWEIELLREGAATAAENESSTVLFGVFGDISVLLTADAGPVALTWACDYAELAGINFATLKLIQVPHHGSRSNVTPTVLNRLIGPRLPVGTLSGVQAVVSCPPDDSSHPRKMVLNAFRRRGVDVYKTQGITLRCPFGNIPHRDWEIQAPFPWFNSVEQYD